MDIIPCIVSSLQKRLGMVEMAVATGFTNSLFIAATIFGAD
jgi:hypothetical protein